MIKVGVLYGGRSGEHEVSLCSAASVVKALNPEKYEIVAIGIDRDGKWYVQDEVTFLQDRDFGEKLDLKKNGTWLLNNFNDNNKLNLYNIVNNKKVEVDIVFPVVHGTYCEDGTLQGLLEMAIVPYVGADVAGSSICIDKDVSKRLLRDAGIPIVNWVTASAYEWKSNQQALFDKCIENLNFPLFIKPARTGSSVGVKKVTRIDDFQDAMDFAFQFDSKVLVEDGITAREVECAVLGNEEPVASELGEITPAHEFYSYEAKYIDPDGAALSIPANITPEDADSIKKAAVQAYRVLECSGMARVDFFIDKNSGKYYLNELNTLPGFTSISMYPKLWEYSGLTYGELCDQLIKLAFQKHEIKVSIKTEI